MSGPLRCCCCAAGMGLTKKDVAVAANAEIIITSFFSRTAEIATQIVGRALCLYLRAPRLAGHSTQGMHASSRTPGRVGAGPAGHRSHNVSDVDATDVNRPAAHGIHDVEPEKF